MAIVVEDGTIVAGANSWVTRDDFIAYAAARGVIVADTSAADVSLIKACDHINSLEPRLKGSLVDRDQSTAYPRTDLEIENWHWGKTEIPRQVLNAQLSLAMEYSAGQDPLNPPAAALPVVSKRVEGAIHVQYANPGQALKVTKTQPSSVHIRLLLRNSGLFAVRT